MSLINLKSKKEPQYFNKISEPIKKNSFIEKQDSIDEKNLINTSSSLLIGEGVTITGTIKISNMDISDTTLYFDVERFLAAR